MSECVVSDIECGFCLCVLSVIAKWADVRERALREVFARVLGA